MLLPVAWPAPANIRAVVSTRRGGVSSGVYRSLNLGLHVGDEETLVATNRQRVVECLNPGLSLQWLDQVHGSEVVVANSLGERPQADGCISNCPGLACVVMSADCLPLLLCSEDGSVVAAAHVGWRGLVAGIIEATLVKLLDSYAPRPANYMAWLGPAIGPTAFQVGEEVREACLDAVGAGRHARVAAAFKDVDGFLYADLYSLASERLLALGVARVYGGNHCTYSDPTLFYSHRRDGPTGRMASLIYLS
ncbi:MAG: YfiH family protein [Halieaceae bacterium]|jgi:YfiH family protein